MCVCVCVGAHFLCVHECVVSVCVCTVTVRLCENISIKMYLSMALPACCARVFVKFDRLRVTLREVKYC